VEHQKEAEHQKAVDHHQLVDRVRMAEHPRVAEHQKIVDHQREVEHQREVDHHQQAGKEREVELRVQDLQRDLERLLSNVSNLQEDHNFGYVLSLLSQNKFIALTVFVCSESRCLLNFY
jgi:hypothetical protein